jgi:hypothetical protein
MGCRSGFNSMRVEVIFCNYLRDIKRQKFIKENKMNMKGLIIGAGFLFLAAAVAAAKQGQNDPNYVSRAEYNALKQELESMKAELAELKKRTEPQAKVEEKIAALDQALNRAETVAEESGLGSTKLLIAGDAAAGYTDEGGTPSTFTAEFNPMLLWKLNERMFFEGGLELAIDGPDENGENSETDVELDSAYLTYILNDYVTVGAGKFTTPFTVYHRHFDPSWINKLPLDPLVYADGGIAPDSSVGAFLIGAMPIGQSMVNYATYLSNGPALITDDPGTAGSLNFDNYSDQNYNKAFGFRLGYLPVRELEIGYSFEFSKPSPSSFQTVHSYLHGVDLNYVKDSSPLKGRVTVRSAWVWSQMDTATYDPTGALGFGPLRFDNDRNGGYVEAAYRPTKASDKWLNNLEFALRYDQLNVPSQAPGGGDETRWIPGLSYWITPFTVFKAAFAFDDKKIGKDNNIFMIQLATGF